MQVKSILQIIFGKWLFVSALVQIKDIFQILHGPSVNKIHFANSSRKTPYFRTPEANKIHFGNQNVFCLRRGCENKEFFMKNLQNVFTLRTGP